MAKIIVQNVEINVTKVNNEDYICLTDMIKAKDGDFFVTDWLRNRNTLEYLGIWENLYNPNFNYGEFATIRNQAGLNSFKISVKEFVSRTNIMPPLMSSSVSRIWKISTPCSSTTVCHRASDSSNSIRLPSSRCRCWRIMKVENC